ncbi:hypothetical protein OsJ_35829 [Oryza sativa Japonica Group]|uniref:Uncharacterized protein n=1 Tax=Oryza sativa subsp. japonica TaxID=39947 RepID=B9GCR8_ORYSJ|nr:hypothetical protein OsJ_35829 [Oryza sativa Japonica Group]
MQFNAPAAATAPPTKLLVGVRLNGDGVKFCTYDSMLLVLARLGGLSLWLELVVELIGVRDGGQDGEEMSPEVVSEAAMKVSTEYSLIWQFEEF